jgi:acyl-coenzyme A thioesterase PaaI-like protein
MNTGATTDFSALRGLHRECFACGPDNHAGLKLLFEVGPDGIARAEWQPSREFRGYAERIHGGVIATLLDSSIVNTLFAKGVAGVTVDLAIRYLHGVNANDPVHVAGWVESGRHGLFFCRAEARQAGVLCAKATARFMAMPYAEPSSAG